MGRTAPPRAHITPPAPRATRVVAGVFALLVLATIAAFFVTQRLKREPSLVGNVKVMKFFSPNGDGVRDSEQFSFRLKESDDVEVTIVDADGDTVRELGSRAARAYRPEKYVWDGRDGDGERVADGRYRVRIGLRDQGRSLLVPDPIELDTTPPRPVVVRTNVPGRPRLSIFRPGHDQVLASLKAVGPFTRAIVDVYRTDVRPIRKVAEVTGRQGRKRVYWDGLIDGDPAPQGTYLMAPRVTDRAGNVGSTPSAAALRDPAGIGRIPGRPGVMARELAAQVPLEPVRGGERFDAQVDSRGRQYRWRLRKLGTAKEGDWEAGAKPGRPLHLRAPGGESAIHLLELRIGGTRLSLPITVQSRRRADVLVVLPATTWLGEDAVDLDGDGLPDRLDLGAGSRTGTQRVLNGLPAGFADEIGAPLTFLDRAGLTYDLTTDLALARDGALRPTDRPGVLLLGQARWQPDQMARRLRRYALRGGRVAVLEPGGLRSTVTYADGQLTRPTAPGRGDLFGARLAPLSRYRPTPQYAEPPNLVTGGEDRIGLFEATDGTLVAPRTVERIANPGRNARVLAQAAQEVREGEAAPGVPENPNDLSQTPDQASPDPVVLAARVGRGIVIRTGLPGFAANLCAPGDPTRPQLMRNVFDILRGVKPKARDAAQGCGSERGRR